MNSTSLRRPRLVLKFAGRAKRGVQSLPLDGALMLILGVHKYCEANYYLLPRSD